MEVSHCDTDDCIWQRIFCKAAARFFSFKQDKSYEPGGVTKAPSCNTEWSVMHKVHFVRAVIFCFIWEDIRNVTYQMWLPPLRCAHLHTNISSLDTKAKQDKENVNKCGIKLLQQCIQLCNTQAY
eukprot:8390802-Ditylum_brightwellii.AAC.1